MKFRFSECGRYLHVALLEGHRRAVRSKDKKEWGRSTDISLLVGTYRLCRLRPSRSPPCLIHRVKVELDTMGEIPVKNLPYTLTWTSDALFVTCSSRTLRVFRIKLFNPGRAPYDCEEFVHKPCNLVYLPDSAAERKVWFFPSGAAEGKGKGKGASRVVIGAAPDQILAKCDVKDSASPLISCFLTDQDLGGWEKASICLPVPVNRGIGQFDRNLEAFDSDEDCDRKSSTHTPSVHSVPNR